MMLYGVTLIVSKTIGCNSVSQTTTVSFANVKVWFWHRKSNKAMIWWQQVYACCGTFAHQRTFPVGYHTTESTILRSLTFSDSNSDT